MSIESSLWTTNGFHEVISTSGDIGSSYLLWSLCALRQRRTLVVPIAEAYDYVHMCNWAGIKDVYVLKEHRDVLGSTLELMREGDIGQVLIEGLGQLLGSGKQERGTIALLGDVSLFAEVDEASKENNVALYTTSYRVSNPIGNAKYVLGGSALALLSAYNRFLISRVAFVNRYGIRIGEKYSGKNILTGEEYGWNFRYEQGPAEFNDYNNR